MSLCFVGSEHGILECLTKARLVIWNLRYNDIKLILYKLISLKYSIIHRLSVQCFRINFV